MTERPLPAGWVWTTLAETATWGSGGTPKRGTGDFYGGSIPWAVIGDLTDGSVSATEDSITTAGLQSSSAKIVPANAVLIAMYGSIGKLGLPTREMATNQAIAFAIPDESRVDRRFLFWYLAEQRPALIRAGKGGTQQNISQTILKAWPIPLPPLPEQHRIVETLEDHLSRLDAAEGLLRSQLIRARNLLDQQLATAISEAGGDSVQVAAVLLRKPANGRSVPTADVGFPVLRLTALRDGVINLAERKTGEWSAADAANFLVRRGDILMSRGNGSLRLLGRASMVSAEPDAIAYPDTMIRLVPDPDRILSEYLVSVWNSRTVRSQIESAARTTAGIYKINQSIISNILIPLPALEQQRKVVSEVSEVADTVRRLTTAIQSAATRSAGLRRALLRTAFDGELVDQDPTDEPADIALAKIRDQATAAPPRRRRKESVPT